MTSTPATTSQSDFWPASGHLEALLFDLNGETLALDAKVVQEILDVMPETRVPGSPNFVSSVINFRGKVIPLADIRIAFGMDAGEASIDSRIIVIEVDVDGDPVLVGIKADKVHEVTSLSKAASEAPPSVGMRWRADYISCLVKREAEFIIIPNLQAIFTH
ncbi:MAG: chemotaxis protein CheW [Alphaproteobacteria bacterium]|nr:chemotaxis protein CheW [Alphaproteobacteria bacterium]MBU1552202.1 chemotaxis protein CheW [Alphaproteobacteria bacterium]MBU2336888.1 chemotaxis protein CheW [Alphaproteobacteria bacterium]MBU2389645.1 chemotaxis protein CheW [Alphaproteobacteria bacterium]|tara:strand:+ start:185 stop:667 length:483 start_codon:yes stop_codon:yes gene_type:complete